MDLDADKDTDPDTKVTTIVLPGLLFKQAKIYVKSFRTVMIIILGVPIFRIFKMLARHLVDKLDHMQNRKGASNCYRITIHTTSGQEIFVDALFSRNFILASVIKINLLSYAKCIWVALYTVLPFLQWETTFMTSCWMK